MHTTNTNRSAAMSLGAALCAMLVTAGAAFSQSASPQPAGGAPSEASIVEALKSKGATRGVVNNANAALIAALKQKSTRGIAISTEERGKLADAVKDLPVQDMEILFELNSADISPKARPNIDALGRALQNAQLKGSSFLLAGHTDASGSSQLNQTLSERRAQAVRQLLIDEFKLTNEQFIAVGYGPERLKDTKKPYASENRRVQVVNLGE